MTDFNNLNPIAYGIQEEIKATVRSLTGDKVDFRWSNSTSTAYTDGVRIVVGIISMAIPMYSAKYWWLKGKSFHESYHCQDTDEQPHMHDLRAIKNWTKGKIAHYIHNIVLDHSIEQNQNYSLYSGCYVAIREMRNIWMPRIMLPGLLSKEAESWNMALFLMDYICRTEWMPDIAKLDVQELMSFKDTEAKFNLIKDLKSEYLQLKSHNPDKDIDLMCKILDRFGFDPDQDPPEPDQPEDGEDCEEGADGGNPGGKSQGEQEAGEGDAPGRERVQQEGDNSDEQGEGTGQEKQGQEQEMGQDKGYIVKEILMDNHEESVKQNEEAIKRQEKADADANEEGHGFVHDVTPMRIRVQELL